VLPFISIFWTIYLPIVAVSLWAFADRLRQYATKATGFGTGLPSDQRVPVRLTSTQRQLKSGKLSRDW
jgi:hypothetical protein